MEKTLHLKLSSEDVGKYAFVPGDPGRCELIAKYLESPRKVVQNREYTTYEGYLEGQKVIVTSTGIGGPSAAICIEELNRCGVDTFIRIGTCASTHTNVSKGDVVVVNGAVRMEGTGLHYLPMEFPAIPNYSIMKKLEYCSIKLGYNTHVGISITKDSFFTQIEPQKKPVAEMLINKWDAYVKGGAVCTAMEEATLFLVAHALNVRAGSVLVSATNYENKVSNDTSASGYPTNHIDTVIKVGIEAMRAVILEDMASKR